MEAVDGPQLTVMDVAVLSSSSPSLSVNVFDCADDHVVASEAVKPVPDAVAELEPKLVPVPSSFVRALKPPKRKSPLW